MSNNVDELIIQGDFNFNVINWSSGVVGNFGLIPYNYIINIMGCILVNFLNSNSLHQLSNHPNGDSEIRDLVFSSLISENVGFSTRSSRQG